MSFFAGVYNFRGIAGAPAETIASFEEAVSDSDVHRSFYNDHRLTLVHGDLKLFSAPGYVETDDLVAALAGEPLLQAQSGSRKPRDQEIKGIARSVLQGDLSPLADANGTYAACCYAPGTGTLLLIADSLGARPLYYYRSDKQVYFSTSLGALEKLKSVPKRADLIAYGEQAAFCYPLGSRTLYRDIRVLRDGECLAVDPSGAKLLKYSRWDHVPTVEGSRERIVENCYTAFSLAIEDRTPPQGMAYSLLSGGLDSRCIVAELLKVGAQVTAINCALPGYQDSEYASRFAREAGIALQEVAWSPDALGTTPGKTTAGLLSHAVQRVSPGVVFSGDGGGETLGFLMMTPSVMALMREGRIQEGVRAYLDKPALPKRLFSPGVYRSMADAAEHGMMRELSQIKGVPPEKAMQLFLLTNDLRRHLHDYFDNILRVRTELLLPFYDRRVISSVVAIPTPLEPYLQHSLYHDWLQKLPAVVQSAPWQAYSSHLRCPIPDPNPPANQKAMMNRYMPRAEHRWMREAVRAGFGSLFPSDLIPRKRLLLAAVLHSLGVQRYGYAFKACLNIHELVANSSAVITEPAPEEIPAEDRLVRHDSLGSVPDNLNRSE